MEQYLEFGNLLYDDGNLAEEGYAFSLVKKYNRSQIKASKRRIKEFEGFHFVNDNFALNFDILDFTHTSFLNVYFVDFSNKEIIAKTCKRVLKHKRLPTSPLSDISIKTKNVTFEVSSSGDKKHIKVNLAKFKGEEDFRCDIYINENYDSSLANAKSFEGLDKHFVYLYKKNLFSVNGYFKIGEKTFDFDKDSYMTYSWLKGVLPASDEYLWANMSTKNKKRLIGFNFGYGLGSEKYSSENILYIDDQKYKFENIHIDVPISKKGTDEYMDTWKIRSEDGMVDISFTPFVHASIKHIGLRMLIDKNRVYGKYKGSIIVNNERIVFDDVIGLIEKNNCLW